MAPYQRSYPEFALCGLNCGLCPRYHTTGSSRCPGCGGNGFDKLHPTCAIITCSQKHGGIEYCYACNAYPCARYQEMPEFDSFITYQSRIADQQTALKFGIDAYRKLLEGKIEILNLLIDKFDDGRRKGFYCLAVNLLNLEALRSVMKEVEKTASEKSMDRKELAQVTVTALQTMAAKQEILLYLRAKPKKRE